MVSKYFKGECQLEKYKTHHLAACEILEILQAAGFKSKLCGW